MPIRHRPPLALAAALCVGLALPAAAQSNLQRYGARDPRTCASTAAPASGGPSAAQATQYFICAAEKLSGGNLYLVDNVKVQVGGGVRYTPNLGAFEAVNVRSPLYPIRGSYTLYQCRDLIREYSGPAGQNCLIYEERNATGYCYRTTFNDWRCYMADRSVTESSRSGPGPRR